MAQNMIIIMHYYTVKGKIMILTFIIYAVFPAYQRNLHKLFHDLVRWQCIFAGQIWSK